MPLIDSELEMAHVIEERRLHFEQFVKEQTTAGNKFPGKKLALHTIGHRDSFGEVVYGQGMHRSLWILPSAKNNRVLIYTNRSAAEGYAKSLVPILKLYGYVYCKVWVEEVAIITEIPRQYTSLMSPDLLIEDKDRYIIRIKL